MDSRADGSWSLVAVGDSLPYAQQDCGGCPSLSRCSALRSPLPRVHRPEATTPTKQVLDAFSKVVCDVAAAHDATCVDTYHAFNGQDGLQPAGPLLAQDYTHPSAAGHERIAELLGASGLGPLRK